MGSRKHAQYVMEHAADIAAAVQAGASLRSQMEQYHTAYPTITRALFSQMSRRQWRSLSRKRLFRPGSPPPTVRNVGTVTVRNDKCGKKFRWIKISAPPSGQHKWIPYARYVWEQTNGLVPPGSFIVHVDGNTLNDDLHNLQVTRAEHLLLQMKRDPTMVAKARLNAGLAAKHRRAANRKTRRALQKQHTEHEKVETALRATAHRTVTWWECTGCGCDFSSEPTGVCPKCNSLRFTKITQREANIHSGLQRCLLVA